VRAGVFAVLSLAACTSGDKDSDPYADGQPHIIITAPDEGTTQGQCFTMDVEVYNFTLVNPVEEPDVVEGHGHWHAVFGALYFDCESARCDIVRTSDEVTEEEVVAQLVGNDHNVVNDDDGNPVNDARTWSFSGEPCPKE
jgi:hypothetical protein